MACFTYYQKHWNFHYKNTVYTAFERVILRAPMHNVFTRTLFLYTMSL